MNEILNKKVPVVELTDPDNIPLLMPELIALKGKAAAYCFELQGLNSNTFLNVTGIENNGINLCWDNLKEIEFSSLKDNQESTEWGAEAVAFIIVKYLTNFNVVERSRKGTGFDYHISKDSDYVLFQNTAKLEISGILKKSKTNSINNRIKYKIKQATEYHNDLALLVIITEFSSPQAGVYYAEKN